MLLPPKKTAAPSSTLRPVWPTSSSTSPRSGRKISNWWTNLEVLALGTEGIGDSLFGFRVYPVRGLAEIMQAHRWMRRFDFDVEAVVRLCWRGV